MYSEKLEEVIAAALADGNLTEQKRKIIMRRAEKEGEDVEEVMMVVESRLQEQDKAQPKRKKDVITSEKDATIIKESIDGDFTETVNGVSFKMIKVEGGTFTMFEQGENITNQLDVNPFIEDYFNNLKNMKRPQKVTLDDYYICETLVTQELWKTVMGSKQSQVKSSKLPIDKVSWEDCKVFLEKLNKLTKKSYHLPSEAQWEYAAIGGKHSLGYKYAGSDDYMKVAWCCQNTQTFSEYDMLNLYNSNHFFKAKKVTDSVRSYFCKNYNREWYEMKPVAQLRPNELGLYDMSGNVEEYCEDVFDFEPMLTGTKNPICRGKDSDWIVVRSFSCSTNAGELGIRNAVPRNEGRCYCGFRIAL